MNSLLTHPRWSSQGAPARRIGHRILLACGVALLAAGEGTASPGPTGTAREHCADFLAIARGKPIDAQFHVCERTTLHGTPALRATYHVRGSAARAVEAQLARSTRMPRLRNLCCGWESMSQRGGITHGHYRFKGERCEVSMSSGDTAIHDRLRWA